MMSTFTEHHTVTELPEYAMHLSGMNVYLPKELQSVIHSFGSLTADGGKVKCTNVRSVIAYFTQLLNLDLSGRNP